MSKKQPGPGDVAGSGTDTSDEAPSGDFEDEIRQYVDAEDAKERRNSPPSLTMYPGTSSVEYDYTRERQNPHPANLVNSTAHLVKGCMGAGMLGIQEAFMHGGIWTSFACTILIGILIAYIMLMLVSSVHKMYARIRVSRLSYPDLIEAAVATGPAKGLRRFSKVFRYTVDLCLFIEMFGTCCIFELILARTLKQGLEEAISDLKTQNLSVRIYVLIVTIPLILLCMIRSLKYLAPAAMVASLIVTFIACATTIYSVRSTEDLQKRPAWKDYHGFFRFLGTCIYSVQGVTITLPLENNMRSPHHFPTVLQFGMSLVVGMVTAIGFLGYWGYGEQCDTPISIHLPLFTSTIVLQFFLAIMMSATFALHFWITFSIVWYYIGRRHRRKREIWERVYRAINVILISGVSSACTDINLIMSFLGAVICSWICFVLPAFIDSLVSWRERKRHCIRWSLIRNICIMTFGVSICLGTFVSYIL